MIKIIKSDYQIKKIVKQGSMLIGDILIEDLMKIYF